MEQLEYEDMQGLLRFGYGYLPCSRYLFLRLRTGRHAQVRAKDWLSSIADEVATAVEKPRTEEPTGVLQIAFTADGLAALGLFRKGAEDEVHKMTFLPEFLEGMAEKHRAKKLGDTGGSAPENWKFGGPGSKQLHLVLVLFARTPEELKALYLHHRQRYTAAKLKEVYKQDATLRPVARKQVDPRPAGEHDKPLFVEPFGYVDGISRVVAKGALTQKEKRSGISATEISAGEFILGYQNAYKQQATPPLVPAAMDPEDTLEASRQYPSWKELGRNGTYMVIRKLRQDVRAFEQFLEEHSQQLRTENLKADPKELLAAKLMGRWRSGAPLSLCPHEDDPQLGSDVYRNNAFTYAGDEKGLACPISSHIRRSNPRDSFSPPKKPQTSMDAVNRHQLIRRGRPYRETTRDSSRGHQEGLLFVALNANIGRQFEFIQQTWMNSPKFHGLYDSRDPIAGDNHDPALQGSQPDAYSVTIPTTPVRKRITGLPRFVHVEGGAYFFLPGINALRALCRLPPDAATREPERVAQELYGT